MFKPDCAYESGQTVCSLNFISLYILDNITIIKFNRVQYNTNGIQKKVIRLMFICIPFAITITLKQQVIWTLVTRLLYAIIKYIIRK